MESTGKTAPSGATDTAVRPSPAEYLARAVDLATENV